MRYTISFAPPVKFLLVALLFTAFASTAFAQSTLSGRVFEFHTRIPVGGAKVENMNTHVIVTTDTGGRFTIQANKRDLIAYSALSYKTDSVLVTSLNYKEVFLESTSKQLQDVNITSNNVGINKGASFIPQYVPPSPLGGQTLLYQTDSQGNAVGGLKVMVPGSKDKAAEARKQTAKLEADDKTQLQIKKQFSADNLKNYVPLEGQEMENFMLLYTPSLRVYRSNEFDFPLYVNKCYKDFMKLPEEKRKSKTLADINTPAN
jgi:hypothetical protein